MIYTSYFAKIRKMPENVVPVSISQWPPKGYSGLQCKDLAPTKDILMEYKDSDENNKVKDLANPLERRDKEIANPFEQSEKESRYNERYINEVLGKLDLKQVLSNLQKQIDMDTLDLLEVDNVWESKNLHIALVCFEKSGDFCHRNLVAEKLKEIGIPCRELDDRDLLELAQSVGCLYNFHER